MRCINTISLSFLICFSIIAQDRKSDSLALVSIYNDLGGVTWTENGNWLSDKSLEEWAGVTIENDRITVLTLSNNNIKGEFPGSLYQLTAIRELNMFNFELEGNLSSGINTLVNLEKLSIYNCGLSGPILADFSGLPNLNFLRLGNNELTGQLPLLPASVETFEAVANQLEGEIPSSWIGLNLEVLNLDRNNLTGNFDVIASMEKMINLVLSDNNWEEGPLPEWLDELPKLRRFLCHTCNLTGDIPEYDFSNTPDFNQVFIDNNKLSGNLGNLIPPKEIQDNFWLQATDNLFEGELPLDKVYDFFKLYVNGNKYSSLGPLNYEIFKNLRIYNNNFTPSGFLPELEMLLADTLLNIIHFDQNLLLEEDTIIITETSTLTIEAGDDFEGNVYSWYKDGAIIDGEVSSTLQVLVNEEEGEGEYFAEFYHPNVLTENGELGIFTRNYLTIKKDLTSALSKLSETKINLYPNPAAHTLNFSKRLVGKFYITNILGQTVKAGTFYKDSSLNIQDLEVGHYFLNYTDNNRRNTIKFVVQ